MKNFKISILILIILIGSVCISAVSSVESDQIVDGLNSTSDMNQALNDAKVQNKSVLLLFDQDSCYYCDLLKDEVLTNQDVQKELNDKFILVVVDINKEAQLAGQYRVVGTPTAVALDCDSKEIGRIDGYLPADEFLDSLKEI